jgi:hypothetical protein
MFYVLSSHNIYALKRQFKTLPIDKTTVIINTTHIEFRQQAISYCEENKVRYFVTESDGTAATGKNSFLDRFEEDGVPYAVLIDGDDYLTKRGVVMYQRLVEQKDAPDALVLFNQVNITAQNHHLAERSQDPIRPHEDPNTLTSRYVQQSVVEDWDKLADGRLVAENVPDITVEEVEMFKKYISTLQHSMGIDELSTRLVFMSRKVLPYRFKSLTVGEDTLQYLELKDAHERGELKLVAHDEKFPTYMYDVRISGIALKESQKDQGKGFIEWMQILLSEMESLKENNKLHDTRVPIWEF